MPALLRGWRLALGAAITAKQYAVAHTHAVQVGVAGHDAVGFALLGCGLCLRQRGFLVLVHHSPSSPGLTCVVRCLPGSNVGRGLFGAAAITASGCVVAVLPAKRRHSTHRLAHRLIRDCIEVATHPNSTAHCPPLCWCQA